MKIERIDDQTVKCFISNQELDQYGISYKDFIMRSDKAKEIMEKIMKKAGDLVGYQAPGAALDLQIMMLPEQGMLLTLSEKSEGMERKHLPGKAGKRKEGHGRGEAPEGGEMPETGVFAFPNLDSVIALAGLLPAGLRVESVLYKLHQTYYLEVSRSSASLEKFRSVCARAMEYGLTGPMEEANIAYLREHARVMIGTKALRKLGGMKGENEGNKHTYRG